MRPFHHARSSASRSERDWREDLPIHEFIDSSKAAFADLRHRMILHSADLGGELASLAFPDRTDAREIVVEHVIEDLGESRNLADWLQCCRLSQMPRPHPRSLPIDRERLIGLEQKRFDLADSAGPKNVFDILSLPAKLAPNYGYYAWSILCNSFGVAVVRRLLGPPHELAGKTKNRVIFDPAWCAESMIFSLYRTIPELRSVVLSLRDSLAKDENHAQHNSGTAIETPF